MTQNLKKSKRKLLTRYFITVSANGSNILSWKSNGLSLQSIKPPTTSIELSMLYYFFFWY